MWEESAPSVKASSLANEARLSKEVGFRLTPGSGNGIWPTKKGDGSHPLFMFELKETQKSSISIGDRVLAKLCREAAAVGKDPAVILSAYGIPDPIPKDWVAVPAEVFKAMLEMMTEE